MHQSTDAPGADALQRGPQVLGLLRRKTGPERNAENNRRARHHHGGIPAEPGPGPRRLVKTGNRFAGCQTNADVPGHFLYQAVPIQDIGQLRRGLANLARQFAKLAARVAQSLQFMPAFRALSHVPRDAPAFPAFEIAARK
jgi:hypothetical protein